MRRLRGVGIAPFHFGIAARRPVVAQRKSGLLEAACALVVEGHLHGCIEILACVVPPKARCDRVNS